MPFSFNNDNAAASGNAGRALANLGNFLYEQQVQKPYIQAQTAYLTGPQTAATLANTAYLTGPQTDAAAQALIATKQANAAGARAAITQNWNLDTDGINDAVNGTQKPSASPPLSVLPRVLSPGSSRGATPVGDSVVPGSAAGVTASTPKVNFNAGSTAGASRGLPISNDDLSPLLTTPGKHAFPQAPSEASVSALASAPAASPLGVNPEPQVTSPAAGAFDMSKHPMTPFYALPDAARKKIIADRQRDYAAQGFHATEQEIAGQYTQLQAAAYPSLMQNPDLVFMGVHDGQPSYIRREVYDQYYKGDGTGAPTGEKPFILKPDGGFDKNPNFTTADKVADTQSKMVQFQQAQASLSDAENAVNKFPGIVGPLGGAKGGKLLRYGQAVIGQDGGAYAAEGKLGQFLNQNTLDKLADSHVGRVNEGILATIKGTRPAQDAPKSEWDDYFAKVKPAMKALQDSLTQELQTQTGKGALPPVDLTPSVAAPKALPTYTPAQAASAPKGTHYLRADNGQEWVK